MDNGLKDFAKKHIMEMVVIFALIVLIPTFLTVLFNLSGNEYTAWNTEADGMLQYCGSVVAFLGTLFLGIVALIQNDRVDETNRRLLNIESYRSMPNPSCSIVVAGIRHGKCMKTGKISLDENGKEYPTAPYKIDFGRVNTSKDIVFFHIRVVNCGTETIEKATVINEANQEVQLIGMLGSKESEIASIWMSESQFVGDKVAISGDNANIRMKIYCVNGASIRVELRCPSDIVYADPIKRVRGKIGTCKLIPDGKPWGVVDGLTGETKS